MAKKRVPEGSKIQGLWKKLDEWLKNNEPDTRKSLRKGASDKTLAAAEKSLGLELSEPVKESYRIHDGQELEEIDCPIWQNYLLLPADRMEHERRVQIEVYSGLGKTWDPGWVPFLSDLSGDLVYLDLTGKGPSGRVVRWEREGHVHSNAFESFEAWLEDILAEIAESEKGPARPRPEVPEEVEAARLLQRAGGETELADLTRVLALVPELRDAYFRRARARAKAGDYAGAIEDVKRGEAAPLTWSERAKNDVLEALQDSIRFHEKLGDWEGGLAASRDFENRHPRERGRVAQVVVDLLLGKGDMESAARAFDERHGGKPRHDPPYMLWRARAQVKLGRIEAAAKDYDRSEMSDKPLYLERGLVREQAGDIEGAITDLERYVQLSRPFLYSTDSTPTPDTPEVVALVARIEQLRKNKPGGKKPSRKK